MKSVCIILLNYNGTNDTIECIKSIENINKKNIELKVIIIDNNSNESEINKLENYLKKIYGCESGKFSSNDKYFLLKNHINIGFSAGNNVAIRFAEQNLEIDYYLLLNNDTILQKESIVELIKAFNESNVGAASGLILDYESKKKIWYSGGYISSAKAKGIHENYGKNYKDVNLICKDTKFLSGCYVIFRRDALLNIQLLNERYFFGTEEYDYSIKLRKLGYKLKFMPNSIIYHKVKITEGNGSSHDIKDPIYIYNSMRNKYILRETNGNKITSKLWNTFSIVYIKYILFSRLEKKHGEKIYSDETIKALYSNYKLNLKKLFIDYKEFNEVKTKLNFYK